MKTWMDGRRNYVQNIIAGHVPTTNPPIAVVMGEPRSPTPLTSATLFVSGTNVTQYRYSLNGGALSSATPIATPITLAGLTNGSNVVSVIGAGSNGIWQVTPTLSKTWVVNTTWPAVRINEVFAYNSTAFNHNGTFPDVIELYNEGNTTIDLSGLRLSDKLTSPGKYTFPSGTTLAAGAWLAVYANNSDGTPGIHTGFGLDQDGEGVFLFNKTSAGGALLDSVEFGAQLADYSLGRLGNGGEFVLTQPTPGATNIVQAVADPRNLKINEWLADSSQLFPNDFVELYNPSSLPVALGGLYFTDNPIGAKTKNEIPALTFMGANSFFKFIADSDPEQGAAHLNFKLPAEQGLIALLEHDLETIDVILYGPQREDISQGRTPDGGSNIVLFVTPTPGTVNSVSATACTVTTASHNFVTLTNVWRFNQSSNLDAVNWQATNYNDATWLSGPGLLAAENNATINSLIHTTLTAPDSPPGGLTAGHGYYFRTTFELTEQPADFLVSAYLDDGAIIYVNGAEAKRVRMGAGSITNGSFSSGQPSGGDTTSPDSFTLPISFFHLGTNTIAVEVHQSDAASSDVVWGMTLDGTILVTNCGQSAVVLNEVFANNVSLTNTAGRAPDWVELYNGGTNAVDLGDLSLSDSTATPRKWVFPPGSSIAPGNFLVIDFDDGLPASSTNTGFGLGASGDAVYLFKRPADGGGMIDSVIFGLQAADFSIARNVDGVWALSLPTRDTANVTAGLGNPSALKINEWRANSTGDDWVELFNPDPQPVDLSGLAMSDNPSRRNKSPFPPLSYIAPNGFLKLTADSSRAKGADHLDFALSSSGGFIGLFWPIGTQIDTVSYGAQALGNSQGRFPDGSTNLVTFTITQSPGAPNFLPLPNLVINEVLSHTDPPLEDALEIQNVGPSAVDLGGWYLANSDQNLRKYLIAAGTIIAPGGFKVFYENQFNTASANALVPFTFNSAHGDEAHLSQTDGAGNLTGYRARVKFDAAANGVSFGRFVTSAGEDFAAMSRRSFGVDNPSSVTQFRGGLGATNPYPLVGPIVISEIEYHPTNHFNGDTNAAEFVELQNISGSAVPLFDPAATTNTWRIAGGIDFTFPTNQSLAANARLLLVSFDPSDPSELAWFSATYSVPTNVAIYGPYSGALDSAGDNLKLLKPDPPQTAPHPDAGFVPYILVEHVDYLPATPWPTNGIATGASLQRATAGLFANEPLNWFNAAPTAGTGPADADADGLPDYWEIAHNLNPLDSTGINGAQGDADGDGQPNLSEFLSGTNPRISIDVLKLSSVGIRTNNLVFSVPTLSGYSYSVLYRGNLTNSAWQKLLDFPADASPATREIIDPLSGPARFYRVTTPAWP